MCLSFYWIAHFFWKDSTKNILAFTAGAGNTGYFGIPVALALFNDNVLGLVVLSVLGFVLYENSIGFFIIAKGHHTMNEALLKVVKLPTIYAFFLGLIVNLMSMHLGSIYADAVTNFKGAYTILGMLLIGLGLSGITALKFDFKFIGITFLAKFIIWPLLIVAVIIIDKLTFKLFDASIEKVMILMSIVPLAANTVVYATQLKAQPEKASLAVFLSTLFALIYIPLIAIYFFEMR
jgi:predicted permease